jgi:N-acetylglucosamine malate deacetylase 1
LFTLNFILPIFEKTLIEEVMILDVIVFAAHPDDAELSVGGTIAKYSKAGYKVGIIDLTRGELGTRGSAEIRMTEAANAAKILKLAHRENLEFRDGSIKSNEVYLKTIITKIRKYKPQIIFAPYFNDRHPDHIGTSQLVKEAMFCSGLPKIETEDGGQPQTAYRPRKLFYFMQTYEFEPSFIVDISSTFKTKMESVYAYGTQFHNPESTEPETFISQPIFLKFLEARAQYFGFKIGKEYGEAFFCEEEIEMNITELLTV